MNQHPPPPDRLDPTAESNDDAASAHEPRSERPEPLWEEPKPAAGPGANAEQATPNQADAEAPHIGTEAPPEGRLGNTEARPEPPLGGAGAQWEAPPRGTGSQSEVPLGGTDPEPEKPRSTEGAAWDEPRPEPGPRSDDPRARDAGYRGEPRPRHPLEEHLTRKSTWLRLVFIVVFGVVWWIAEVVLTAVVVLQFLWVLFTGEPNERLRAFGQSLSRYAYQLFRYVTFNSDARPFPFDLDWPSGARDPTSD